MANIYDFNTAYDFLKNVLAIDNEALDLAFAIGGCSLETAERILFYYTGYHTFEGYIESEMD